MQKLTEEDFGLIIAALHFQTDNAFDFLRAAKMTDSLRDKPFIFCCIRPSQLTKTMAEGLEVAGKALGAADYCLSIPTTMLSLTAC